MSIFLKDHDRFGFTINKDVTVILQGRSYDRTDFKSRNPAG